MLFAGNLCKIAFIMDVHITNELPIWNVNPIACARQGNFPSYKLVARIHNGDYVIALSDCRQTKDAFINVLTSVGVGWVHVSFVKFVNA